MSRHSSLHVGREASVAPSVSQFHSLWREVLYGRFQVNVSCIAHLFHAALYVQTAVRIVHGQLSANAVGTIRPVYVYVLVFVAVIRKVRKRTFSLYFRLRFALQTALQVHLGLHLSEPFVVEYAPKIGVVCLHVSMKSVVWVCRKTYGCRACTRRYIGIGHSVSVLLRTSGTVYGYVAEPLEHNKRAVLFRRNGVADFLPCRLRHKDALYVSVPCWLILSVPVYSAFRFKRCSERSAYVQFRHRGTLPLSAYRCAQCSVGVGRGRKFHELAHIHSTHHRLVQSSLVGGRGYVGQTVFQPVRRIYIRYKNVRVGRFKFKVRESAAAFSCLKSQRQFVEAESRPLLERQFLHLQVHAVVRQHAHLYVCADVAQTNVGHVGNAFPRRNVQPVV